LRTPSIVRSFDRAFACEVVQPVDRSAGVVEAGVEAAVEREAVARQGAVDVAVGGEAAGGDANAQVLPPLLREFQPSR